MSVIRKIRGLWRFDGDDEPITVTRRGFIMMGGIVAASAAIPAGIVSLVGAPTMVPTSAGNTVWVAYAMGGLGPIPCTDYTEEGAIQMATVRANSLRANHDDFFEEPRVFTIGGQKAWPIHMKTNSAGRVVFDSPRVPPKYP